MKVLVIEDEKKIASFVRKGLEAQGFVVEVSPHGDEGYVLACSRPYDALMLDIMLPGKDGLSILRNLRERKLALPVILLTARSELNERLEGLNLGADDYLTKPFHIEELIARFGLPPPPVRSLLDSHRLRILAKGLGIVKIDAGPDNLRVQFMPQPPIDPMKIIAMIQSRRNVKLSGPDKLNIAAEMPTPESRVARVLGLFKELS